MTSRWQSQPRLKTSASPGTLPRRGRPAAPLHRHRVWHPVAVVAEPEHAPDEPSLAEIMEVSVQVTAVGVPYVHAVLPADRYDEAAACLAREIATRRIPNDYLLTRWDAAAFAENPEPLTERDKTVLSAHLLQNVGTPEHPATESHLTGLIAESLWLNVITRVSVGPGRPLRVEGHDWSATDPGGDGLTVYGTDGQYSFRLWESKYHGADSPARETVHVACRQVRERAPSYLARFSLVEQHIVNDPDLARFYSRLTELWVDRAPEAGVGIAVGARNTNADEFERVVEFFELGPEQHQGHLNLITNFQDFAERVRRLLWKGAGLWNEH